MFFNPDDTKIRIIYKPEFYIDLTTMAKSSQISMNKKLKKYRFVVTLILSF